MSFKLNKSPETTIRASVCSFLFLAFFWAIYSQDDRAPALEHEMFFENIPYQQESVITQNLRLDSFGAQPKVLSLQLDGWTSDTFSTGHSSAFNNTSSKIDEFFMECVGAISAGVFAIAAGLFMMFAGGVLLSWI